MNKIFKYGTMLFIAFNIIQFSNKKKILWIYEKLNVGKLNLSESHDL